MAEQWSTPPWIIERDLTPYWFYRWQARQEILNKIAEENKPKKRKRFKMPWSKDE